MSPSSGSWNRTASAAGEERLESWKEVASYLGKTVRTVQTWEKDEGLPVHRHQHDKQGTVFAYPAELDRWLDERSEAPVSLLRRFRLTTLGAAAVGAVVALTVVGWLVLGVRGGDAPGARSFPFEERDWVLIAAFENRTGEEIFDGTLEAALKRELAESRFVNVASPERVGDTLQLMGRPLDTPLSAAVAREVAQRDGAIRGVLTGRVAKLGPSYALSVDLVSPADGVTVASLSEKAEDEEAILPALSRLSRRVRESLGESLPTIRQSEENLSQVSTPSFRALQLYSQANQFFVAQNLGGPDRNQAAEALLREAIAEDPEFASAYIHLSWALRRLGRPPEEFLLYAEQAFDLAEGATVAERYFIRGSFYSHRSFAAESEADSEAALAQYQALLVLDPGHFWAHNNARMELQRLGRHREVMEFPFLAAESRPTDFRTVAVAAQLARRWGDIQKALLYAERAASLQDVSAMVDDQYASLRGDLHFIPIYVLWVEGDIEAVLREVDRTAESLSGHGPHLRQELTWWVAGAYVDLGMLRRASQIIPSNKGSADRAMLESAVARLRGNREKAKEWLQRWGAEREAEDRGGDIFIAAQQAERLARLGFLAEAERNLTRLSQQPGGLTVRDQQSRAWLLAARGTLAFARGHYEEAIPQLEESTAFFRYRFNQQEFLISSETLARAWRGEGNLPQATLVLEEATLERGRMMTAVPRWMSARLLLADLYRELGREEEALEVETELRRYCLYADPDFVIRQELERRQQLAV